MYGVIDIGSNTIRLSIYRMTDAGFRLIFNTKNTAGLVGYVNKHGNLSEKGIKKTVGVLRMFDQILKNIGVRNIFVFATASLRNIGNTREAVEKIRKQTGFGIDVLSGEQEAVYGFTGASLLLDLQDGIIIDIGGGSTELVFYRNGQIEKALSMPIGSLSLYNRHVHDILPTDDELSKIKNDIRAELKKLEIDGSYHIVCGVGGTVRGACKLNNEILGAAAKNRLIEVANLRKILCRFDKDRVYAVNKIIKTIPSRIHTIIPGMTILDLVARKYSSEKIIVSEYGVREGYLYTKLFVEGIGYVGDHR